MDNQHKKITGYRDLTEQEIALMNEIKAKSAEVGELHAKLQQSLLPPAGEGQEVELGCGCAVLEIPLGEYETDRWLRIGQDHLQQGFMALTRAVARPTSF
ncbi:DUF7681 family protein [Comamonas thiooxydans]|uniref:Acb2/Tad1 hairpin domain-containing protein n=1 Tax=Comamonas thiooxydans TaxID=363952 RepID=A0A0E3BS32_9BURK|nr:hypothetical protein [Comamonas thiooxydans]KGH08718.1 hypothetical protein P608_17515 [Comamonas thiooxydans]KGH16319.1 hypothetical protein P607_20320 [Comamonas thiooxydans]KGH20474.1 hypothetical protein P606_21025 [Comamonas thiooxydans]